MCPGNDLHHLKTNPLQPLNPNNDPGKTNPIPGTDKPVPGIDNPPPGDIPVPGTPPSQPYSYSFAGVKCSFR